MPEAALVLAAGRGTRMRSSLAKVLHPLLGRPMVWFPVSAAQEAGLAVTVVVHHQEEAVRAALVDAEVTFARQEEPRGTGDAVRAAIDSLPGAGMLVVLAGDTPLLRPETLKRLMAAHRGENHGSNRVTVLTARVADPTGYGRILRGPDGRPARIVEQGECSLEEQRIDEINTGVYAFDLAWLREILPLLQPHPPKDEIYLTDAVALAASAGRVGAVLHGDPGEVLGVNDRWALAEARRVLQQRLLERHALAGVTFEDPASTLVEVEVELGEDITVGPGVVLRGRTRVGDGAVLGPYAVLEDAEVGPGATVHAHSVVVGASIGEGAIVGPLARLRPGASLGAGAHVGNFVEIKNSRLGPGAKANHLAYLGDAEIGAGANIGAGTITCNYDGFRKHRTVIGERAFIGSNSALVAPVSVGAGAMVGAGSVITRDVPADASAVARGTQENREGGASRLRAVRAALQKEGR